MTVLASLARAYDRLADRGEVPPFGYSREKIGFLISLNEDGTPAGAPIDLRQRLGHGLTAPQMQVPQAVKRTSGIAPNFLWDKTSYVLGVTASKNHRKAGQHAAFIALHEQAIADTNDPGLRALLRFLQTWTPDQFAARKWPEEMKDQNVVFALESERRSHTRIHDRPAARSLCGRMVSLRERPEAICLVSGRRAPVARLHPAVKGVCGAQSSGASLVSFNLDASTSYGHEQGDNAPVSEAIAFAYATALSKFLERNSRRCIQIGALSIVFWVDGSDTTAVQQCEALLGALIRGIPIDERMQSASSMLHHIREGRSLSDLSPEVVKRMRCFVLGLSPNAARLAVRFFLEGEFGEICEHFLEHLRAMRIVPPPKDENPSIWPCLIETAAQREIDNIPSNLAAECLRTILMGRPYPLALLTAVLMRLRTDKELSALRVAILKAVITRNFDSEVPVSLDRTNKNPGYLLGRLLATYEYAQTQALGGLKAPISGKYYCTASTTPRCVFPRLHHDAVHHLSNLRKSKSGVATYLERSIEQIFELSDARQLFLPTLTAQRQASFALGYYHESDFYRRNYVGWASEPTEETPV
jgi:CRISPR-associated protein Csd1